MKYRILNFTLITFFISGFPAFAADYTANNQFKQGWDDDYVYYYNDTIGVAYACGTASMETMSEYQDAYYLTDGQTLYVSAESRLLYCCEDLGYWINYGNTYGLPTTSTCETKYNYVPLGGHKFCRATQSAFYNRCLNFAGTTSGIMSPSEIGGCEYAPGTCATFTHCETGYYKNGSICTACPDGGTTGGYTDVGITACYLQADTTASDSNGTFVISNGQCPYVK